MEDIMFGLGLSWFEALLLVAVIIGIGPTLLLLVGRGFGWAGAKDRRFWTVALAVGFAALLFSGALGQFVVGPAGNPVEIGPRQIGPQQPWSLEGIGQAVTGAREGIAGVFQPDENRTPWYSITGARNDVEEAGLELAAQPLPFWGESIVVTETTTLMVPQLVTVTATVTPTTGIITPTTGTFTTMLPTEVVTETVMPVARLYFTDPVVTASQVEVSPGRIAVNFETAMQLCGVEVMISCWYVDVPVAEITRTLTILSQFADPTANRIDNRDENVNLPLSPESYERYEVYVEALADVVVDLQIQPQAIAGLEEHVVRAQNLGRTPYSHLEVAVANITDARTQTSLDLQVERKRDELNVITDRWLAYFANERIIQNTNNPVMDPKVHAEFAGLLRGSNGLVTLSWSLLQDGLHYGHNVTVARSLWAEADAFACNNGFGCK